MTTSIAPPRQHQSRLIQLTQIAGQVSALSLFWWASDAIAARSGLPVPGSIVGLLVLLLLLHFGWLPLHWVKAGADWLLAELLLFFIPAVVAVLPHADMIRSVGLQIVFVIVASTAVVMTGTALVVDLSYRIEHRIRLRQGQHDRAHGLA